MLRPQPSTLGIQSPSPPPRPHSPPRGLQIQDSLRQSPPLPAALWTLMLKKRHPVRRQYGQKVITKLLSDRCFSVSLIIFLFLHPHSCHFFAAAVTGYQHPSESASGHASQFYITLQDSNNKEQRLDEKGMTGVVLSTDIQLDSWSSFFHIW